MGISAGTSILKVDAIVRLRRRPKAPRLAKKGFTRARAARSLATLLLPAETRKSDYQSLKVKGEHL